MNILCILLQLYSLCLLVRIILSWFPVDPNGPVASVLSIVFALTEPVLAPIRSVLPRAGMIDFSPFILFLGIGLLMSLMHCRPLLL